MNSVIAKTAKKNLPMPSTVPAGYYAGRVKAFWRYTLARFLVFAVCWGALWGLGLLVFEMSPLSNLVILLVAMLVSAVVSAFLLAGLRDDLARNIEDRATRMTERLEESRSAEDVD